MKLSPYCKAFIDLSLYSNLNVRHHAFKVQTNSGRVKIAILCPGNTSIVEDIFVIS